jgi:hypothetical protein
MTTHTKAMIRKAMWWRVAKSAAVSVIVSVALTVADPTTPNRNGLWAIITFLIMLFYLRFRDDWYGRP